MTDNDETVTNAEPSVESYERTIMRLKQEKDSAFTCGYKAGLEAGAKCADEFARQNHVQAVKLIKLDDVVGHDVLASAEHEAEALAAAIRSLPVREEG